MLIIRLEFQLQLDWLDDFHLMSRVRLYGIYLLSVRYNAAVDVCCQVYLTW